MWWLSFFGLGQATTTLVGGTVYNITFEETINHNGSPIRIALSYDDDSKYDQLILLDHVPHNDAGQATRSYRLEVKIPDIDWYVCYCFARRKIIFMLLHFFI